MNCYDGTTIEAHVEDGDDPAFRMRLNPLILERLRLGPAKSAHFPHQVGILRGRRQLMWPAEAQPTEVSYFGVISKGRAMILDAKPVD